VRPAVPQAPPAPLAASGPAHAVRRRPDDARPRAGVVAVVAAVAALALGAAGWTALRADPSEPPVGATPAAAPCGVDLDGDGDLDSC
jgi:hypothetical protein